MAKTYKQRQARKRRRKIIFWLIILLLAGAVAFYYFCCLNRPGEKVRMEDPVEGDIRVGTVNIDGFRFLSSPDLTAEFLLKCAKDYHLDVLLLQEFLSRRELDRLDFQEMFIEEFPYIIIEGEHVIVSKYPISSYRNILFPERDDRFMVYKLEDNDGQVLNVIGLHLHTTGLFALQRTPMKSNSESFKVFVSSLRATAELRRAQARKVRECVDTLSGPVIVAGDFNSVPGSQVKNIIKGKDLNDSFWESGHGKGSTFRYGYDLLRIDHILHSEDLNSTNTVIPDDYISDHRIVVTNLRKASK